MDPKVILDTVLNREELTAIEALMLMREEGKLLRPIIETANALNERINGTTVTYLRNRTVHYTNICRAECSFCSFYRRKSQRGAYVLSPAEAVRQIRETGSVRQITLQGGLNPDLTLTYHLDLIGTVRDAFPSVHLHGYSPSEVHFTAKRARVPSAEVLRKFKDAGLDSLAGDSADILNDKVRKKICSDKLRTADWIDIIKTAHRLGISTTATILFGHVEDEIYICEHLEIIKNIQRETGGITAFKPLLFVPQNTDLARSAKLRHQAQPDRILQMFAVARIFLGRLVKNIQVDWTKMGLDLAIRAFGAGANDLGPLTYDAQEIRLPQLNGRGALTPPNVRTALAKAGRSLTEREPWTMKVIPAAAAASRREELVFA